MHKSFGRFLFNSANAGIKNKISLQKEEIPQTAWLWDFVVPVAGLEPVASDSQSYAPEDSTEYVLIYISKHSVNCAQDSLFSKISFINFV